MLLDSVHKYNNIYLIFLQNETKLHKLHKTTKMKHKVDKTFKTIKQNHLWKNIRGGSRNFETGSGSISPRPSLFFRPFHFSSFSFRSCQFLFLFFLLYHALDAPFPKWKSKCIFPDSVTKRWGRAAGTTTLGPGLKHKNKNIRTKSVFRNSVSGNSVASCKLS